MALRHTPNSKIRFLVFSTHYQGSDIVAEFDTERELRAWLEDHAPSGLALEKFTVVLGNVWGIVDAN